MTVLETLIVNNFFARSVQTKIRNVQTMINRKL